MSEISTQKSICDRKDKFGIAACDADHSYRRMMNVFVEELLAKIAKLEAKFGEQV